MTDITPSDLPLRYKLMRRGLQVLSYTLPPLATKIALDMFSSPTRVPARSGKTKRVLKQATVSHLPYTDPDLPDFENLTIDVRVWGDVTAPRVLMAHGWEGQAGSFREFIPALTDAGYCVVAFDAPGHGTSTGDRANLLAFMNTMRAVATEHGPFEAVMGHSLGGLAALLTAGEEPRIESERLVLIAAPERVTGAFESFVRFWGLPEHVLHGMYDRISAAVGRTVHSFSVANVAETVTQPVFIIHDTDDHDVYFSNAEAMLNLLPDARLYSTSGLGHQLILRDNDVVAATVAFIREGHAESVTT